MPRLPADATNRRIVGYSHTRQIEAVRIANRVAENAAAPIKRFERAAMLALVAAGEHGSVSAEAIGRGLDGLWPALKTALGVELTRAAKWGHKTAAKTLSRSIPRRWLDRWRFSIAEDIDPGPLPPNRPEIVDPLAPFRGRKLSQEEWDEVVAKFVVPPPSPERVRDIVEAPDQHDGLNYKERLDKWSHKIANPAGVASDLVAGYSAGENIQELTKRLRRHTELAESTVKRIARTEGMRIAEQMQRESWGQIDDLMAGVQIHAQLDIVTRPHHAVRSGVIYYKEGSGKSPTMAELPMLPDEANCRCWSTPVLLTPEEYQDQPEAAARDFNPTGAAAADPLAYGQWFSSANRDSRRYAVGGGRYDAVSKALGRTRQPEWVDFVDEDGNLLSLDRIKRMSPAEREELSGKVAVLMRDRSELLQQTLTQGFVVDPPTAQPPAPRVPVPPAAPRTPATPGTTNPTPRRPRKTAPKPVVTPAATEPAVAVAVEPPKPAAVDRSKPFKAAKSKAEAIAWAKAHDFADDIDYGKLPLEVINGMNESIHETLRDIPELRKGLRFIGSSQEQNARDYQYTMRKAGYEISLPEARERYRSVKAFQVKSQSFAQSASGQESPAQGIGFNESAARNQKAMAAYLKDCVDTGFFNPAASTVKGAIDHEMGHQLASLVDISRGVGVVDDLEIVSIFNQPGTAKGLSLYGSSSSGEFVAEAWSEYRGGNPRPIAKKVGKRLEELLANKRAKSPEAPKPAPSQPKAAEKTTPLTRRRLTTAQAQARIGELGYKIVGAGQTDLKNKVTRYTVQGPDGSQQTLTADEIKRLAGTR